MKRNPLNTRRKKKKLKRELDSDMHLEIVSRLPFKEAVQCRLVCKSWHTLLDNNFLINIHAKTQLKLHGYDHQHAHSSSSSSSIVSFISFSPGEPSLFGLYDDNLCSYKESSFNDSSSSSKLLEDATMINSCNGLICLHMNTDPYSRSIAIYNPVTTELLRLPNDFGDNTIVNGGLGYHPSTKEYKILRTISKDRSTPSYCHQIYTLGSTGKWKNIEGPPFNYNKPGVHVNGAFYWIIHNYKNGVDMEGEMIIMSFDLADEEFRIMSFDLADEEFRLLMTLPPIYYILNYILNNMPSGRPHYKLVESRGCLFLFVDQYSSPDDPHLELWVMKEKEKENDNGGCRYYWSNFMKISTHGHKRRDYEFLALTQSGKVLFWHDGIVLTCFDPKTEKFASISDMPSGGYNYEFDIVPHTNSLVSFIALEAAIPKKKIIALEAPIPKKKKIRRKISYFVGVGAFLKKKKKIIHHYI